MEHYFTNNPDLKSELKELNYEILGDNLRFFSDNGVFSKSEIDYGSSLLVNTLLTP